jgi:RNA polymerase sigma-70 factor, ECF subfamily
MTKSYLEDEQRWAEWMARAQRGDQSAYESLLRETGAAIETYIRVRFGKLEVLEDCVQECLMAIHAARHTYDPGRLFRPWLFTIVRHKTIDLLRQRQTWLMSKEVAAEAGTGTTDVDRLLRIIDGVRILEQLAPDHREMVTLAKYGGYTTAEAAVWLGISESAAKARLQRALTHIRLMLEREGLPV